MGKIYCGAIVGFILVYCRERYTGKARLPSEARIQPRATRHRLCTTWRIGMAHQLGSLRQALVFLGSGSA
jgi:hypothetical protein